MLINLKINLKSHFCDPNCIGGMIRTLNEVNKSPNEDKLKSSFNGSHKSESKINSNKLCCVCLNSFLDLNSLRETNEAGTSILTKLQVNIPEVVWKTDFQICAPCTNLLNIVHNFRETCLASEIKRQQFETANCEYRAETDNYEYKAETDNYEYKAETKNYEYDVENATKCEDNDEFIEDKFDCSENDGSEENDVNTKETESKLAVNGQEDRENTCKRKRKRLEFTCEVCSVIFSSSTTLTKHCVDEHGMVEKNVRPFACKRCESRFANSSNLLQHIKYHDAVRSNICTYCGKGFITKTDLNIHEKQHLNKREYKCDICYKCYNTHKDLRSHNLVVHTNPESWKYFCEMCNKRFPIKSNFDCHMRRHTGDKKFECHLCNKKFTDKCVLQRHMRTHTNIRDFKCSECLREYKDKRVMQIHMAKVHGIGLGDIKLPSKERKYQCHICPKAYYAKNKLTRHLYTHSGERPFYCTICDKNFNDKSYVKQHMKKSHNIDNSSLSPDSLL